MARVVKRDEGRRLRTTTPAADDEGPDHPYSLVRTVDGRTGWVSGCLPYDESGRLVDEAPAAVHHALRVLEERLAVAGAELGDVVKTTVFLRDLSWRDTLDGAYRRAFPEPLPARSAIQVSALPRGAAIEIEAVVQLRDAP